jgi:hypothetical protein
VSGKAVTPALGAQSFTCPHCGALAHQTWLRPYVDMYRKDQPPSMPAPDIVDLIRAGGNSEVKERLIEYFKRIVAREVFIETRQTSVLLNSELSNVSISRCYSCEAFTLWVADKVIYPEQVLTVQPNEDMPYEIRLDFVEAASIVDQSPRGAAALLRLCLQKLTAHLGLKGKNLDDDIGTLVKPLTVSITDGANGLVYSAKKAGVPWLTGNVSVCRSGGANRDYLEKHPSHEQCPDACKAGVAFHAVGPHC